MASKGGGHFTWLVKPCKKALLEATVQQAFECTMDELPARSNRPSSVTIWSLYKGLERCRHNSVRQSQRTRSDTRMARSSANSLGETDICKKGLSCADGFDTTPITGKEAQRCDILTKDGFGNR